MMKHIIFIALLIVSGAISLAQKPAEVEITVMTYNIRFDNPADGINRWDNRKEYVADLLSFYNPDIFGLQEAMIHQIQYLDSILVDYSWIGVGRDDGVAGGEFSPVFYNSKVCRILDSGTFWLSPDPEKPSRGWDAALPRVCTWVKLEVTETGQEIYFYNTHFDHRGEQARLESSRLIVNRIKRRGENQKVILVGDFNQPPESNGYKEITSLLRDVTAASQISKHYGPLPTFSNFKSGNELGSQIDYIFINDAFTVKKSRTITDHNGQYYPSDHLPVIAVLGIR